MRLGGPLFEDSSDPERWTAALARRGYTAAYFPVKEGAARADDYARAAQAAGIVIAEVGAWSNPLSPDDQIRNMAVELCQERLALADRVGALCCVNIAGSLGTKWDGPHAGDLTDETFALIVDTVRSIIDAVKPGRSFYTLEPMPWMYPDSAQSYMRLIKAIDRKKFGVHFDPVNLISSPQLYFANGLMIRTFVADLGPYIRSCHAKDIVLAPRLTVHLDEVRPGTGGLDYVAFLQALDRLGPDMPLMLEHMKEESEYLLAADYIRGVARQQGVALR